MMVYTNGQHEELLNEVERLAEAIASDEPIALLLAIKIAAALAAEQKQKKVVDKHSILV